MRKLNDNEKKLALLLSVTLFILGNLIFLPGLLNARAESGKKIEELQLQVVAAEVWMNQSEYWAIREAWIQETEPALDRRGGATADQLEELQETTKRFDLEMSEVQLLPPEQTEFFDALSVRFTVAGEWSALVQWLAELQSPSNFNVIPRFSLRSDAEPTRVHCEMELQRWFRHPPADS